MILSFTYRYDFISLRESIVKSKNNEGHIDKSFVIMKVISTIHSLQADN